MHDSVHCRLVESNQPDAAQLVVIGPNNDHLDIHRGSTRRQIDCDINAPSVDRSGTHALYANISRQHRLPIRKG
jgi:hypothetical protein